MVVEDEYLIGLSGFQGSQDRRYGFLINLSHIPVKDCVVYQLITKVLYSINFPVYALIVELSSCCFDNMDILPPTVITCLKFVQIRNLCVKIVYIHIIF